MIQRWCFTNKEHNLISLQSHGTNDTFVILSQYCSLSPHYETLTWIMQSGISQVIKTSMFTSDVCGVAGVKKRWERKKHKHTTVVVSTHLTKYRQKIFNDVFTDPVGVSLQHVALIPLHPCIPCRKLNVTLKCEIVVNCSCFAQAFFIVFNVCFFWSALNKFIGISFLLSTGNGWSLPSVHNSSERQEINQRHRLVWLEEQRYLTSAFWRVCLFKLLISAVYWRGILTLSPNRNCIVGSCRSEFRRKVNCFSFIWIMSSLRMNFVK